MQLPKNRYTGSSYTFDPTATIGFKVWCVKVRQESLFLAQLNEWSDSLRQARSNVCVTIFLRNVSDYFCYVA